MSERWLDSYATFTVRPVPLRRRRRRRHWRLRVTRGLMYLFAGVGGAFCLVGQLGAGFALLWVAAGFRLAAWLIGRGW